MVEIENVQRGGHYGTMYVMSNIKSACFGIGSNKDTDKKGGKSLSGINSMANLLYELSPE